VNVVLWVGICLTWFLLRWDSSEGGSLGSDLPEFNSLGWGLPGCSSRPRAGGIPSGRERPGPFEGSGCYVQGLFF